VAAALTCGAAAPANAQGRNAPDLDARRLTTRGAVRVDGLLDEAAWGGVAAATEFRQREPTEGAAATEGTEVRVVFDETTLYIGVLARHNDSDGVIARILQRDRVMRASAFENEPQFAGDDAVAILLDPFHDHRNAVVLATNPNGAEFDALLTDEGREFNVDWRGVWEVAAQRTDEGWSAEFAIPFRSLRFPSDSDQPWGFNVYRVIRGKNEEVLWSSWSRANEGFARVSRAGHLHGLTDLPRAGMNLEVKPYVLGGVSQDTLPAATDPSRALLDTDSELDLGVDLKYEVRPGLLLDLTLNTDFAQVEADSEQVNLTRFSLFFPEKRDFFLENAGIFEMGWRSAFEPPPFLLFFSRQIGISDDEEIPVLGGARLTGRIGAQTVGFMDVVTDDTFEEPKTNFAVARLKRDFGPSNYLGGMVTDRRSSDGWNTAGGADFSVWPGPALNLQGFVAGTATSGVGGDGAAWRIGLDYQQDRFGVAVGHLGITDEANAEMGFVTRTDILQNDALVRATPRPQLLGLRKLDLYWNTRVTTRVDGVMQDWLSGPAISPQWDSGESLTMWYLRGATRLDEEFEIRDDVFVPAGDYDANQFGWIGSTSHNRPVVLSTMGVLQDTYDGTINMVSGDLQWTPTANVSLAVGYTYNRVDIPADAFNADLARMRLSLALSTRLTAHALLQYNDEDDLLAANLRINFIHRPGSDLFIVFNEKRGSDASLWDLNNRAALMKVTYLARL
jgi:hypothetical protein